jgi:hypothetical protein
MSTRRVQPAVTTIIASVLAITAGVLVATAASAPALLRTDGFGVLALLAATVALQFRSLDIAGKGSVGVSAIAMATAAVVVGTALAMAIAVVAALVQWRRRRGPLHRALFDVGNFALATAAAGFTFAVVAGEPAVTPSTLLAATLAGGAYALVNNALLCFVMSVDEGRPARKVWDERFRWALPTLLAFAPIVAFAAIAYEGAALAGVAVVLGTPLLLSAAMKARLRRVSLAMSAQSEPQLGRP